MFCIVHHLILFASLGQFGRVISTFLSFRICKLLYRFYEANELVWRDCLCFTLLDSWYSWWIFVASDWFCSIYARRTATITLCKNFAFTRNARRVGFVKLLTDQITVAYGVSLRVVVHCRRTLSNVVLLGGSWLAGQTSPAAFTAFRWPVFVFIVSAAILSSKVIANCVYLNTWLLIILLAFEILKCKGLRVDLLLVG